MTKVKYTPKNFEIPTEGVHDAELIEIKELGMVDTPNGEREKVRFVYGLDDTDSRGKPLLVFQTFNLTLHPQSRLSKTIYDLTGKDPEEGEEYELNDLLGTRSQLVLKHQRSEINGKTYANVAAILRPQTAREEAEEKRVAEATAKVKQAAATPLKSPASSRDTDVITDEDIPF